MAEAAVRERRSRFEAVALAWTGALYRAALRLTGEPGEATALVEETFLRAFGSFETFVPGSNARAWLLKMLYAAFGGPRQGGGSSMPGESEGGYEAALVADGSGGRSFDTGAVEAAIRQLPEPLRSAVVFVDGEELSYEEAAAVLDCPVVTLRARLFRGRKLLFATLAGHAPGQGEVAKTERA